MESNIIKGVLRSLLILAIYRSSFDDLLTIYNLLKEYDLKIPFHKDFQRDFVFLEKKESEENEEFSLNKIDSKNVRISSEISNNELRCVDSNFLYVFSVESQILRKFTLKSEPYFPDELVYQDNIIASSAKDICVIGDFIYIVCDNSSLPIIVFNKYNFDCKRRIK